MPLVPEASRGMTGVVQPEIDTGDEDSGEGHVVILEEDAVDGGERDFSA